LENILLVSDLIKELQTIEINHDRTRYYDGVDMLGPAEIVIDAWDDGKYLGYAKDIVFDLDPSNGYWLIRSSLW
jgi:hypothetical protein